MNWSAGIRGMMPFAAGAALVAVVFVSIVLFGCDHQSEPRTVADEAKLADCIAREAATEVAQGVTAQVAAETIAIACGTDALRVTRDLVFGKRMAVGTKGYAVQHAGKP